MGKKLISQSSLGRASTSIRRAQRMGKESKDVSWAEKELLRRQEELRTLEEELEREIDILQNSSDPLAENLEQIDILPKKLNISIRLLTLCWLPYIASPNGSLLPAWIDEAR